MTLEKLKKEIEESEKWELGYLKQTNFEEANVEVIKRKAILKQALSDAEDVLKDIDFVMNDTKSFFIDDLWDDGYIKGWQTGIQKLKERLKLEETIAYCKNKLSGND